MARTSTDLFIVRSRNTSPPQMSTNGTGKKKTRRLLENFSWSISMILMPMRIMEHLHDPHWHEVTLLLLAKLGRKPLTVRLRQLLEGKIKSRRSCYRDIVQQDL